MWNYRILNISNENCLGRSKKVMIFEKNCRQVKGNFGKDQKGHDFLKKMFDEDKIEHFKRKIFANEDS